MIKIYDNINLIEVIRKSKPITLNPILKPFHKTLAPSDLEDPTNRSKYETPSTSTTDSYTSC